MNKSVKIIYAIIIVALGAWIVVSAITMEPQEEKVRVFEPVEGQVIESPLTITGEARGYWFFEGSFYIQLLDTQGNELASATAQATDEWTTEEFVPFEASMTFDQPESDKGMLVFNRDNPSGLPEYEEKFLYSVTFKK